MLSNPQKSLLKRAQRQAGLSDSDYREALHQVTGCNSSTDPELTDRHLDKLLAYFEAIYWQGIDAGQLQLSCNRSAVFQARGFWARRNTPQETSRDRFNGQNTSQTVADLERRLADLGCNVAYCAAIRRNVCNGRSDARALHLYQAALERTLKAKTAHQLSAADPY